MCTPYACIGSRSGGGAQGHGSEKVSEKRGKEVLVEWVEKDRPAIRSVNCESCEGTGGV